MLGTTRLSETGTETPVSEFSTVGLENGTRLGIIHAWARTGRTYQDYLANRAILLLVRPSDRADPQSGTRLLVGFGQVGTMSAALFSGLVVDELDRPVGVTLVGGEPFYVVDDDGFLRHVESRLVDRQVLEQMRALIQGNEELISQGTMKMLGQEDIFTKAMIEHSLRNVDAQFDQLLAQGLPEEARAWMGMLGFRVVIDVHGNVVRVDQPSAPEEPPQ